jgi:hypothetical protein
LDPGDDDAAAQGVARLSSAEASPDATVQSAGDEDGPARACRKKAHAGVAAFVVVLGQGEHVIDDDAHRARVGFGVDEVFRGDAIDGESVGRKVDAAGLGVFEHIARDVRELHGDAEVDRVTPGARVADAENGAHHETDGAGCAIAVADELAVGLEANDTEVRAHADEELAHDLEVDAALEAELTEPEVALRPKVFCAGLGFESG